LDNKYELVRICNSFDGRAVGWLDGRVCIFVFVFDTGEAFGLIMGSVRSRRVFGSLFSSTEEEQKVGFESQLNSPRIQSAHRNSE
jgi:hypothetical protein